MTLLSVNLNTADGAPAEGTYTATDADPYDEELPPTSFGASRTRYLIDYAELTGDTDCDAYANDPEGVLFDVDEGVDAAEFWTLTGGELEVAASGSDAWQLTLTGGVEQLRIDDGLGDETPVELAATFERCDVEYNYPQ